MSYQAQHLAVEPTRESMDSFAGLTLLENTSLYYYYADDSKVWDGVQRRITGEAYSEKDWRNGGIMSALLMLPSAVMVFLGGRFSPALVRRLGAGVTAAIAAALMGLGAAGLALWPQSATGIAVAFSVLGLGNGIGYAVCHARGGGAGGYPQRLIAQTGAGRAHAARSPGAVFGDGLLHFVATRCAGSTRLPTVPSNRRRGGP